MTVYYSAIVMTIIGILNFVLKHSVLLDFTIGDVSGPGVVLLDATTRFRVQSTFINPFDYGYMCLMLLAFSVYLYYDKCLNRIKFILIVLCCLFGVLTCNCRTVLICLILGGCIFVFTAFKGKNKLKNIVMIILVSVLAYSFIPVVQEKVDQSLTAFTDTQGRQVGGSNLDMRALQFARVLYHIQGHELFGRGLDYFLIDMGWNQYDLVDEYGNHFALEDPDLAGMEGLYLSYLLERGFVGLAIWVVFNVALIVYFIKGIARNRIAASIGLVTVTIYILFANMTGELNSLPPTLLFVGILMKIIDSPSLTAAVQPKRAILTE